MEAYDSRKKAKSAREYQTPSGWVSHLRSQCKKRGLPFNLSEQWFKDNPIPEFCPVFPWLKLSGKRGLQSNDAQLDRKIPDLGYCEGNVRWVSARANRLKDNATLPEMIAICEDLKVMQKHP
jgi:hypothetical protein